MSGPLPLNDTSRRGYPLAALFVLVTASAALIAAIAPVIQSIFRDQVGLESLLWSLALGGVGGMVLGTILGIVQFGWRLGAAIGVVAGTTLGIAGGLLSLASADQLPRVAVALVVGSGLMIGVAIFMRQNR